LILTNSCIDLHQTSQILSGEAHRIPALFQPTNVSALIAMTNRSIISNLDDCSQ